MKVSHSWLQKYFDKEIPTAEKLVDLFTFHSFEIEGVEEIGNDKVIDAKILPDRAHYALSHKGIAHEISVLTGLVIKEKKIEPVQLSKIDVVNVTVEIPAFCPRYMCRVIENVTIKESSEDIQHALIAVGARSINSIVDATNYVMFDCGQPLHAFDKDKVVGGIIVRYAHEGEKMVTLDSKEVVLTSSDAVIADDEGILAIAGVKGGKKAEVTNATKSLIIESANFNASQVRKTSTRVGIRNESSKRYENAITPHLIEEAMAQVTAMIMLSSHDAKAGDITDVYVTQDEPHTIDMSFAFIREALGVDMPQSEIISILKKFNIKIEKHDENVHLIIPRERLDLVIPEDIAEEVGRVYGYDKVPSSVPEKINTTSIDSVFYYTEKIKSLLVDVGLSEVYLYSLTNTGEYEVAYPLASNKSFLRTELRTGIIKALEMNAQNAPALALDTIKIFEIGTVFSKKGEYTSLAIGIKHIKKVKGKTADDEVKEIWELIENKLQLPKEKIHIKDGVLEVNISDLVQKLPKPENTKLDFPQLKDVIYKPFSVYPFILRDVAVFVPEEIDKSQIEEIITSNGGELLLRLDLFDVFTKKFPDNSMLTSYAYHLVFQSHERTLTDVEINPIMESIYNQMTSKGWSIR